VFLQDEVALTDRVAVTGGVRYTYASADADSVLTARIVADTKRMQVESPTDQSRMVEMNIQVLVTWADRGGAVLATGAVPLPAASVDVGQAAVLVPEYGRSVVSTQQEGIAKMAQQIVGLMEEPW
jgi:hypothetical protein